jgi:hypothetical protein
VQRAGTEEQGTQVGTDSVQRAGTEEQGTQVGSDSVQRAGTEEQGTQVGSDSVQGGGPEEQGTQVGSDSVQRAGTEEQGTRVGSDSLRRGGTKEQGTRVGSDSVRGAVDALESKVAAIAGEKDSNARYLTTAEGRTLSRINSGLGSIVNALDSADAAPTTQEIAMVAEIEKALDEQLAAWSQLKSNDVSALNDQLKKAGLPPIDLQKASAGSSEGGETTSQNRDQD